ncbi:hypothetical protein AMJ80_04635 [bacterium SM23_31]|nr:MAG: hypothetical protein AMJ80_04635 [bacterium SM23_31]
MATTENQNVKYRLKLASAVLEISLVYNEFYNYILIYERKALHRSRLYVHVYFLRNILYMLPLYGKNLYRQ